MCLQTFRGKFWWDILKLVSFQLIVSVLTQLKSFALGAGVTADCSLVVFTMGPVKSRPFTMAIHAMIGAGFLFGTLLVKPFLPDTSSEESYEKVPKIKDVLRLFSATKFHIIKASLRLRE